MQVLAIQPKAEQHGKRQMTLLLTASSAVAASDNMFKMPQERLSAHTGILPCPAKGCRSLTQLLPGRMLPWHHTAAALLLSPRDTAAKRYVTSG